MLSRRTILAAAPALAACAAPCGPTHPPQPQRVLIGHLDIVQDLHGQEPDPVIASWPPPGHQCINLRGDDPGLTLMALIEPIAALSRRT